MTAKNRLLNKYRAASLRSRSHIKRRPYIFPLFGLLIGVGVVLVALWIARGSETLRPSDTHIIYLFDNRETRTVDTRAKTVGELLNRLSVKLVKQDVVEPSLNTPIVEDNFRINIYRARPVVVIDSNTDKIVTLTAQKSPRVVAQNAGMKLQPEDKAVFAQGSLQENIIGEKVVITRALPVLLNLYGDDIKVYTQAKTVGDMLKEKAIEVHPGDTVRPKLGTPIKKNMQVAVIKNGTRTKTESISIPAPTQYVTDPRLSFGATVVRQAGSPGKKLITYQIVVKGGVVVSKKIIQQAVVRDPVPQIIARGSTIDIPGNKTAVMAAAGISSGDYGYVNFIISHESGWRPDARNASGCLGLGQACPGSKLYAACPDLNAVCQLRYFSGYAGKYGGWGGAYNFWQGNGWW